MSELEGSGSRSRDVVRSERRAARALRQQDSRIADLEASPFGEVIKLELTTTPQNVRHNLRSTPIHTQDTGQAREWVGAVLVKRGDAGLGNLVMTSTPNDKVFIGLSLDGAAGTVSVVVF